MKPPALKVAVAALTLAVLAGIAETVITVVSLLRADGLPPGWQLQIGVRVLVYTGVLLLIGLTWRGSRMARWTVLILLGVVGLGSLVVPMITELAAGRGIYVALGGDVGPTFAVTRALHILLVVVGSIVLLAHRPVSVRTGAATDRHGQIPASNRPS